MLPRTVLRWMVAIVLLHLTAAFTFGQQSASIQGTIRDVDFDGKPGTLRFRRCATAALRKLRLRGARADKQKVRLVFGASLPSPEDP